MILEVSEERVEKDENSEIELKEDHILGDTNNSRGTRVFKSKAPCLGRLWCLWDHKWVAAKRALSWIKVLVVCLFVGFLGAMYLRAISYMATGSFGYKIDRITVGDQLNLGDFFVTLVMAFLSGLSMFLTGKAFKNWTLDLILHHQSAATWNDGSNEIDYTEEESDDRSYSNDDDDDNKQIPLKVDILHGGKVHHVQ